MDSRDNKTFPSLQKKREALKKLGLFFLLLFQENEVWVVKKEFKNPDTPPVSDGIPIKELCYTVVV